MAAILQQLSGNPLATPIGQRIEQATNPALVTEDWNAIMEICDMINDTDEGPKDAVRAIKRRFQQNAGKNHTVIKYTLTVLETCVKNCGRRFHLLVTNKDFIQDLVKLIGPKNDPPAALQEKVLSLIQYWSETFRGHPDLCGVVQVCNDLKAKGIEFPPSNYESMVPIHTPQRSVPVQPPVSSTLPIIATNFPLQPPHVTQSRPLIYPTPMHPPTMIPASVASNMTGVAGEVGPLIPTGEQLEKLKRDLDVVNANMRVLDEMLVEMDKSNESTQEDWELITELQRTCDSMQKRIVELIERVANEEITSELLRMNDEMNVLFARYASLIQKRELTLSALNVASSNLDATPVLPSIATPIASSEPVQTSSLAQNVVEASLIDLDDPSQTTSINTGLERLSLNASKNSEPIANLGQSTQASADKPDNEFDMFAQMRSIEEKKRSPLDIPNEQEVDEMEKWLLSQTGSISAPSQPAGEDFERFLAQRAVNLERQPNISQSETKPKQREDLL